MKNKVLNETPVRTSKNYGINNIEIKDFEEPVIKEFKNIKITDNENCVLNHKEEVKLKFGLGEYFLNQSNEQSNVDLKIDIDKKLKEPIIIEYNLDKSNNVLVDNININAKDNTKANIIVIYKSVDEINGYHNGICSAQIGANADIHVTIVNLLNTKIINLKHLILNITLILIAIPLIEETRREINNSINLRTIQPNKKNIINKIKQNIKNIEPIYRLTKNKIKKIYTVMELKNYSYFANRTKKQYKNKTTEFITLLLSIIIFVLIIIY